MSVNVFKNNLLKRIAGKGVQDADFNANSRNGLQNRIITAWKVLIEGKIEELSEEMTYSNTEQKVGTYFGQDLYRKSYTINQTYSTPNNQQVEIPIDASITLDTVKIIKWEGSILTSGAIDCPFYDFFVPTGGRFQKMVWVNTNGLVCTICNETINRIDLTIYYTKVSS